MVELEQRGHLLRIFRNGRVRAERAFAKDIFLNEYKKIYWEFK